MYLNKTLYFVIISVLLALALLTLASCNLGDVTEQVTTAVNASNNNAPITEKNDAKSDENTTENITTDNSEDATTEEVTTEEATNKPQIRPCPWDDESLPIPEEIKSAIQLAEIKSVHGDDYKSKGYVPEQVWVVCYGAFDNAYCVMTWAPDVEFASMEVEIDVGGYTFLFGSSNVMTVYCDGSFYSLTKAYETGILDDTELEELFNYYTRMQWGIGNAEPEIAPNPWKNESLPIPEEVKLAIQDLALKSVHGEIYAAKGYVLEQVWVICYDVFDNAYCVVTWEPDRGYAGGETIVQVGEYSFRFEVRNVIKVYLEGEFYDLNEAYENGILDDAAIEELSNYYNEAHWGE